MRKRTSALVVLSLAGTVALAVAGFAISLNGTSTGEDPHKALLVSRDAAETSLRKVIGPYSGPITYSGTQDRPGIRTYEFSGNGFRALVDVSDGHVALLTMAAPIPSGSLALSADEAQAVAISYLAKIGSPIVGLDVTISPITGGGFPGYTVQFQRWSDGAALPDYRTVEVDGVGGHVVSLVDIRRPTNPTHPATLTKDTAMQRAVAGNAGTRSMSARLIVTFDKAGNQLEVWEVELAPVDPTAPGGIVDINADTGAVVDPSK